MTMKRGLFAGVLMLASVAAMAEGPRGGGPGPHMTIDKLEILLDLDAYQKQEVQKILETQRAEMRAKREAMRAAQTRPSREEMRAQREAQQQATRAKLEKLLSEQQLKKFDVLSERPRMRERRSHQKQE